MTTTEERGQTTMRERKEKDDNKETEERGKMAMQYRREGRQ